MNRFLQPRARVFGTSTRSPPNLSRCWEDGARRLHKKVLRTRCVVRSSETAEQLHKYRTVKITLFSSAIVIDIFDHCHTAGALLSQTAVNICPYHRVAGF